MEVENHPFAKEIVILQGPMPSTFMILSESVALAALVQGQDTLISVTLYANSNQS